MPQITFVVPGKPFGQPRKQVRVLPGGKPQHYTPKTKAGNYQQRVSDAAWEAKNKAGRFGSKPVAELMWSQPTSGPVSLTVIATYLLPTSKERKRSRPGRSPMVSRNRDDLDRLLNAVMDGLSGVVYLDDGQVWKATVEQWVGAQGAAPGLEVTASW